MTPQPDKRSQYERARDEAAEEFAKQIGPNVILQDARWAGYMNGFDAGYQHAIEMLRKDGSVMSFSNHGDRWADWLKEQKEK